MIPTVNPKPRRLVAAAFLALTACLCFATLPKPSHAKPPPQAENSADADDAKGGDAKGGKADKGDKADKGEKGDKGDKGGKVADRRVSVAILDFDANTPGSPDLGKQIGEVLVATLSGEDGFQLVDRAAMGRVLQENELNLSGLVNAEQATKIGKLVGAKILVTGKAFAIDKQVFMTAKLIGTETSLVEGIVVKSDKADTADLIMQLSQKVTDRLHSAGHKLLADDEALTDPLPKLKARLAGKKLPKVCVQIAERHLTQVPAARVDPAVETEVKNVLIAAGFTVVEGTESELDKAGVDVAVTGEAFSEFNARIANLMSCSGRVEMKAAERKGGKLLFTDRTTTRAVDLAENTAGKTALQKGGRELAIRLLEHFAETLPAGEKGGKGAKDGKPGKLDAPPKPGP